METSSSTILLAEKQVALRDGFEVRQIRRRLPPGRQIPLITTHPTLPMAQVAGALFSRWSQENFFKYMREEFNIDASPTHDLEDLDPDARVVNPEHRSLGKEIDKLHGRLSRLLARIDHTRKARKPVEPLEEQAARLSEEIDERTERRRAVPSHVRAGDLPEDERLNAPPISERLFHNLVRMIAYRAETRMASALDLADGKAPEARELLQALFQSPANIIPEPRNGILRVQVHGLGADALDRAVEPLLKELNSTRTKYPGTELTLQYEINGKLRKPEPNQIG